MFLTEKNVFVIFDEGMVFIFWRNEKTLCLVKILQTPGFLVVLVMVIVV